MYSNNNACKSEMITAFTWYEYFELKKATLLNFEGAWHAEKFLKSA